MKDVTYSPKKKKKCLKIIGTNKFNKIFKSDMINLTLKFSSAKFQR